MSALRDLTHRGRRSLFIRAWALCLASTGGGLVRAESATDAVTFAAEPGAVYVPLDEAARELHLDVRRDDAGRCIRIEDLDVKAGSLRRLVGGPELIGAGDLQKAGAEIDIGPDNSTITIRKGLRRFSLSAGPKRVEVNLASQQLRAWQGGRLVLQCRVSSGRHGSTPAGNFTAGPFRARMHHSSRYHNAPMPWSVQINGHVFIHGFTSVPNYPASHGCIRLPLDEGNPAKFFFEWIDNGSPVRVMRQ